MTTYPVKDAGVDWITVTSSEAQKVELLRDHSFHWLESEEKAGNKIRPWSMSGFQGFHCGGVSFGELNGTWLLRLSSAQAQLHWHRAHSLSTNCSRIDVQVTISDVANPASLIQQHFKEATRHFREWRRKPAVHLWKSNDGSATLYLNKRVSEQFGRIYDKHLESKLDHYKNCLRYEVEYKGDVATLVADKLAHLELPAAGALSRCWSFFNGRGCSPGFPCGVITPISVSRSKPEAERRLQWLSDAVRGPVRDLVACGKLEEVVESLGLREHVTIVIGPRPAN